MSRKANIVWGLFVGAMTAFGCGKTRESGVGNGANNNDQQPAYKPNPITRVHNTTDFFIDVSPDSTDIPRGMTLSDGNTVQAQYGFRHGDSIKVTYYMYIEDTLPDPDATSRAFKMDSVNFIEIRNYIPRFAAADTIDRYKTRPGSALIINRHDVGGEKARKYLEKISQQEAYRIR